LIRATHGAPGGRRASEKIALISLGCAKNLVDSEVMLGALKKSGFAFVARAEDADVIIVNTCGFIGPARMEAEETLGRVLRLKEKDPRKKIVAAGCYVERDRPGLQKKFPGIDAWTGVRSFDHIAAIVRGQPVSGPDRTFLYSDRSPRLVSTPATWAYVKVSEGCSHRCGFCAIPLIKGPYVSRSLASVGREVRILAGLGVKEIDLISHDTTWFGRDRGMRHGLVRLLERLVRTSGVEWIRFLYGYPEEITDPLLEVMTDPKICRYLDIPFQHSNPGLIKAMKRGLDGAGALRLLERIRAKLPGAAVRTSLVVGFPGEGRKEFAGLRDFVRAARFDHVGVFTYSPERGTAAFDRPDSVGAEEKERRRGEIMAIQAGLSLERNKGYIGRQVEVLVEKRETGDPRRWVGRGRFQAPEVDGVIRFTLPSQMTAPLSPIVRVEITSAGAYDLEGWLVP
jgi:ribosomal protein S12 methylthiotransferase